MKRLIKKAEYEDFIQKWYNSWGDVSSSEIDKIINDNSQFKYSGEAYRWIGLPDIKEVISGYDNISYDELINIVKGYVKNDTNYNSWTEYYEDCETYAEHQLDYNDKSFGVIISSNVNGLNYHKFLNYYDPSMDEIANQENEIIGKSNGDFKVIGVTIDAQVYDEDNPCEISFDGNEISIQ